MPIYAYKCDSCGLAKDVLQKMSDAPLSDCPACGKATFKKQLTAAGFQLKGTGWYATDFKGGGTSAPAVATGIDSKLDAKAAGDAASSSADSKASGAAVSPSPAPAPVAAPKSDSAPSA
jgi:putative FmdB family regulatory protein